MWFKISGTKKTNLENLEGIKKVSWNLKSPKYQEIGKKRNVIFRFAPGICIFIAVFQLLTTSDWLLNSWSESGILDDKVRVWTANNHRWTQVFFNRPVPFFHLFDGYSWVIGFLFQLFHTFWSNLWNSWKKNPITQLYPANTCKNQGFVLVFRATTEVFLEGRDSGGDKKIGFSKKVSGWFLWYNCS